MRRRPWPLAGRKALVPWVLLALLLLAAPDAFAGTSGASSITNTFISATTGWYGSLKSIAEGIFYALFGVDFAYLVAQWLIGGKDVHEVFTSFIKKLITIGVFFTILLNGHELIGWVIDGFKASGVAAAGQPHTSLDWILGTGGKIFTACVQGPVQSGTGGAVKYVWDLVSSGGKTLISTILGAFVGMVVGIIAILALIYLALEYLAIQLEAALVASVGIIMMGFAGSRWTVQHAEGYLKYALSVGIRFMVLVIWIAFIENHSSSIITNLLNGVKQSGGTNIGTTLSAYANVLIFVLLIAWMAKKLPGIAASVLTGGSTMSGGELISSGVVAAALGAAALATGGAALGAAGAGAGTGVLTGAEAAAAGMGEAGALTGAAGGAAGAGGTAMGAGEAGSLSGAADAGMENAVQAPPLPPEPSALPESTVLPPKLDSLQNAGPSGAVDTERAAPADGQNGTSGGGQDKPMSLADRLAKNRAWVLNAHKDIESMLSPGVADMSGVQANGFGLKHSE